MNESLFYRIKKKFLSFFADIKLYPFPGFIILFGDTNYQLKGPKMRRILNELQPGDVLVRTYKHYLGSMFTPGYWSHAAIFEGPNDVIHMLGKGIVREDILTFMRCDDVGVLRYYNGDIETIQNAIEKARVQLEKGVKYDYDFNTSNSETFYCTELINYCYNLNYPDDLIIMPDSLANDPELQIIIDREN